MKYLPFVVVVVLVLGLLFVMSRARRRQADQGVAMAERIDVGTEVMTTSGLYGTVVALNDDRTVQLAIAAGIEVRWELAALRDLASLPPHVGGARPAPEDDARAGGDPLAEPGSDPRTGPESAP